MKVVDCMTRETQKEKILRLENELKQAHEIIQQLNNEISAMIDKSDNNFENSVTYKQMAKQIDTLELKIKAISDTSDHNRKMYKEELKRNDELINKIHKLNSENNSTKKGRSIIELQRDLEVKEQTIKKIYADKLKLEEELRECEIRYEKKYKDLYSAYKKDLKKVKIHNERGAGRKQEISEEERQKIRECRAEDHTIKEIAKIFNRSVGIIHKIINEK